MSGVFSASEYDLFERAVKALERIADSVEIRLGPGGFIKAELPKMPPVYKSRRRGPRIPIERIRK